MLDDDIRSGLAEMAGQAPGTGDLQTIRTAGLRKRRNRSAVMLGTIVLVLCGAGFAFTSLLDNTQSVVNTNVADDGINLPEPETSDSNPPPTTVVSPSPSTSAIENPSPAADEPADQSSDEPSDEQSDEQSKTSGGPEITGDREATNDEGTTTVAGESQASVAQPADSVAGNVVCKVNSVGTVSWTDHDQSIYRVYRSTNGGASYTWLARTFGDTSYRDLEYEPGHLYQMDYESMSSRASCLLDESFVCQVDGLGLVIWADDGPETYRVYRSDDGGGTYSDLGRTFSGTSYQDGEYQSGYRYQVVYDGLSSRASCEFVERFVCQVASGGVLVWADHDKPLYQVFRSVDGGETYIWLDRTLGGTTYTDPDYRSDYLYRMAYEGLKPQTDCLQRS